MKNNESLDNPVKPLTELSKKQACGSHCIKINEIGVHIGNEIILDHVNLHVHCGRLTTIIGPNGAGKSTLIKAILDEIPHKGNVEFHYDSHCKDGIKQQNKGNSTKLKIGYVPQSLNIPKNTPTSVYDLFASFISNRPVFLYKSKKLYEKIKKQLAFFQAEELIDQEVCTLSGGELQRVLLSIATLPIPNLLLLDEPVSGIDKNGMELFFKNIIELKNNYDLAVILVSHDLEYVAKYSDYVVLLDGGIKKEGTPQEVFDSKEFQEVFGHITFKEV